MHASTRTLYNYIRYSMTCLLQLLVKRSKSHIQIVAKNHSASTLAEEKLRKAPGIKLSVLYGGRGIRTPGAVNPAVFKTAAIDHSAIPPLRSVPHLSLLWKSISQQNCPFPYFLPWWSL